jgi:hypothetical protein
VYFIETKAKSRLTQFSHVFFEYLLLSVQLLQLQNFGVLTYMYILFYVIIFDQKYILLYFVIEHIFKSCYYFRSNQVQV